MTKKSTLLALAGLAAAATAANAGISIVPSNVAFIDISTTGTSVGSISDDSENTVAGATHGWIGNGLLAGGMSMRVGNNGGMYWGTSATDTFSTATDVGYFNSNPNNAGAPSIGAMTASTASDTGNGNGVRQFLAVLWDDNTPGSTGASTKWQVIGNDLIIQWTNEDHFNASGSGVITYEAILHGGVALNSGLSLVDFVYQDTLYAANQYQDDGGSAAIGFKNWGVNGGANDVEFGIGGGSGASLSDPAFGDASMQAKVGGWIASNNGTLPHSVSIVPAPGTLALLGFGALVAGRRRRA
jgi:hypothetical protein